tara:strand:- start:6993 stop:7274 length:282 start_codon:yes stop_codon:yes gene_type:complete
MVSVIRGDDDFDSADAGGASISGELFTAYVDSGTVSVASATFATPLTAFNALMAASALNTWMLTRFDYIVTAVNTNDTDSYRYQIRKGYRTFS